MLKKDKVRQENIEVNDEMMAQFFIVGGEAGNERDFTIVEKAYRGLTAEYFETFLKEASSKGVNFNAKNEDGKTMLDLIKEHANGAAYVKLFEQYV
jgi:hypothetical protein